MSRIISVSRRTDVPAFYGAWFEQRLDDGIAGWENPFGGQKYLVPLKREDVLALAFWSKNYRPFLPTLQRLRDVGYPVLLNYTITGLPQAFECNLVSADDAIDSLTQLSRMYSPKHISWRYDPIVVSSDTSVEWHCERFAYLCTRLDGLVKRCYFSFAILYGKVERNFHRFEDEQGIKIVDLPLTEKTAMAQRMADIAAAHGIQMLTCCGDYLIGGKISKAHCVDGDIISQLYPGGDWEGVDRPTRKECGCTESTDLGKYDTCPHGCIYCYANINKEQAGKLCGLQDPKSAFLGYSKADSDRFIAEIRSRPPSKSEKRRAAPSRQRGFEF